MTPPKLDIIRLIKEDHKPLKAYIKVLVSERPANDKIQALKGFLCDLELHARTEEGALYDNTVDDQEVRKPVLEGYEEHALADLLAKQLKGMSFEKDWTDEINAKAKVMAEVVKHHIDEEEEEMLPDMRDAYDREALLELGEKYLLKKKEVKALLAEEMENQPNEPAPKASRTSKGTRGTHPVHA